MHLYEAALLGTLARTLFASTMRSAKQSRASDGLAQEAFAWLYEHKDDLNVPTALFVSALGAAEGNTTPTARAVAKAIEQSALADEIFDITNEVAQIPAARARSLLRQWSRTPAPQCSARLSPMARKIATIGETFGLSPCEADVLGLLMRLNADNIFATLIKGIFDNDFYPDVPEPTDMDMTWGQIATTLRLSSSDLQRVKSSRGKLLKLGLVSSCRRNIELSEPVRNLAMSQSAVTKVTLMQSLMGRRCRASEATTKWEDFAHLGPARDMALRLLMGAMKDNARGVVILLHGPPGTGKTAFAQTLIRKAGATGWVVGETEEEGEEATRQDRLSSLLLASALSRHSRDNVLLLDEADDVFNVNSQGYTGMAMLEIMRGGNGSKIFMNNAIEEIGSPTILIVNNAQNLGGSILRRMSLTIHIKTPDVDVSCAIATKILARQKLKVPATTIRALAQRGTPPAVMALAARAAKLSKGGADDLTLAARSVVRTLQIKNKPASSDLAGMGFDPAFANADCDLAALGDAVVAAKTKALSFCLYGIPGTGKSAFARCIAARMDLKVIEKRASDILGMYVGQTEQNIARAFEEAADREAFLIFDEADSLLADRTGATRSWEVSQVNEMLTWMERHPFPFACTTNLMAGLDPAALRRFLFKAEFKAMLPEQARALFARTFGCESPSGLRHVEMLTPGDFAVVSRKASVLGLRDPLALLAALQSEVAVKPGAARVRVGF